MPVEMRFPDSCQVFLVARTFRIQPESKLHEDVPHTGQSGLYKECAFCSGSCCINLYLLNQCLMGLPVLIWIMISREAIDERKIDGHSQNKARSHT